MDPARTSGEPPSLAAVRARLLALFCVVSTIGLSVVLVASLNAEGLARAFDDLGIARGPLIVVAGALLIVVLVPAPLVAAACGLLLGPVAGAPAAVAALTAGACGCWLVARLASTEHAARALGSRAAAVAGWLEGRPLRAVIVARLVPGPPFGLTSYLAGLTRIPVGIFAAGTAIGIVPRSLIYAAVGGAIVDFDAPVTRGALGVAAVILVVTLAGPHVVAAHRHSGGR